jgi:hypothetical protein
LTSATNPSGPHTTTADSPSACSSDLFIISFVFGRPENIVIEVWMRSLLLALREEGGVEDGDEDWWEGDFDGVEQQHTALLVEGLFSSIVVRQQHVPCGPQEDCWMSRFSE